MGEHDKAVGQAGSEIDFGLLETWAEADGASVDAVLGDAGHLDRYLRWQSEWKDGIAEAIEDVRAGRVYSHEEMLAHRAEQRRQWLATR